MIGRVIELTKPGLSVHKRRGFLAVDRQGTEAVRVGFDDVEAVLAASPGITWSSNALAELAARQVPVTLVGPAFAPVAVVLPLDGHHRQAHRFRAQADASRPMRKQAWACIVRQKIVGQHAVLERIGVKSERLQQLSRSVRSGDPDNREAQAAQVYWPLLMGRQFRRDKGAEGANAMLNYGYAVLRAAGARAIVAAGLHPSLSVHHRSDGDALALADDLMEPFRPTIDLIVSRLVRGGIETVPEARSELVGCLTADFPTANGTSPLTQVLLRLAQSLARSFLDREIRLVFPDRPIPMEACDG